MSDNQNKVVVSDLFVDIYTNFNVCSQVENMRKLSKKELYLLIIVALDKHSDEDPVVLHNFLPFESIGDDIFDLSEDKEVVDEDLKQLVIETGDKYISTKNIIDSKGNVLPEPLSKVEVRDAKINIINGDDTI
jgi:hypothetical protein